MEDPNLYKVLISIYSLAIQGNSGPWQEISSSLKSKSKICVRQCAHTSQNENILKTITKQRLGSSVVNTIIEMSYK